jgi:hypothetical protein
MKNTFIFGFSETTFNNALLDLEKNKIIKIQEKYFSPYLSSNSFPCFSMLKEYIPRNKVPSSIVKEVETHQFKIQLLLSDFVRSMYSLEQVITRNIFDDYYTFHLLISFFFEKLSLLQIEQVIIFDAFNNGADFILYLVAKALKIPTTLLCKSHIKNKFFCISDINKIETNYDYIEINEEAGNNNGKNLNFENILEDHSIKQFIKKNKWHLLKIIYNNNFDALEKAVKILGPGTVASRIKKYIAFYEKHAINNIDLSDSFIFFPLIQYTEIASAYLNSYCTDQVMAIRDLAEKLPEKTKIYVQQQALDNNCSLDTLKRLNQIDKVCLLPKSLELDKIIDSCSATALIGGEIGWRTICKNKPVISFGLNWYNNLPGVYTFSPEFKINEIENNFNMIDIEKNLNKVFLEEILDK